MTKKAIPESTETDRMMIRRLRPDMADVIFKDIDRDRPRLESNMPWIRFAQNAEEEIQVLKRADQRWVAGKSFELGLFSIKDNAFMGMVGAYEVDWSNDRCEVGYWILKEFEEKGFVREAVKALVDGLFEIGLHRIEIRCAPENSRSSLIPRRLGFRFEGCLVANKKLPNGEFQDSILFSRLRTDGPIDVQKQNSRPECIRHCSEVLSADDSHYPGSDELLSFGAALGKATGLKKIGIHHEILKPGRRTSWPHAESVEEEFAYVVSGNPCVWINGHLYDLIPGDAVGFPAGTGISHTFINNSDRDAVLLVVGETSKKENRCVYPLHPKRNEEIGDFLWKDCPPQTLGPHDGKPDLRAK